MQICFGRRYARRSARWIVACIGLLFSPLSAPSAILTVGPDGTYATIQAAIDAAVVGEDNEILVQGLQTYSENLTVPATFDTGSILVWGGWDSNFIIHNDNPDDTVLDGDGGRALDILIGGGTFELRYFTITGGQGSQGAGLFVLPGGDASITLTGCSITGNTASAAGDALGAGLWAILDGSDSLSITDSEFVDNEAFSTGGGLATAAGLGIVASGTSTFLLRGLEIESNEVSTTSSDPIGAGLYSNLSGSAQGEVRDTFSSDNRADANGPVGIGALFETADFAELEVRQTGYAFNEGLNGTQGQQVRVASTGSSQLTLGDSGFVLGDHSGLAAEADASATVHLVNLTIADHPGTGASLGQADTATVTLYNTIAFENTAQNLDLSGTIGTGSNLVGTDPLFANPDALDYRLLPGSPAINAGDNSAPGGLGMVDLWGNPRVVDGVVDIGCYEGATTSIFSDDFEAGDLLDWSDVVD